MKGCSKLERLDFVEQTAFNSAYLKVTVSAVAEAVILSYRSLDITTEESSQASHTHGGFPPWYCLLVRTCGAVLWSS